MKIKLAIAGSRDITDFKILELYGVGAMSMMGFELFDVSHIVSGGANGADKLGRKLWKKYKNVSRKPMELIEHLPDWNKYGKKAGFIRNQYIVDDCDAAIVLWDRESKGTYDTLCKLHEARKPYVLINVSKCYGKSKTEQLMTTIQFNTVKQWERLYANKIQRKGNSRKSKPSS